MILRSWLLRCHTSGRACTSLWQKTFCGYDARMAPIRPPMHNRPLRSILGGSGQQSLPSEPQYAYETFLYHLLISHGHICTRFKTRWVKSVKSTNFNNLLNQATQIEIFFFSGNCKLPVINFFFFPEFSKLIIYFGTSS